MSGSHCPHCGRMYDEEVPLTTVRCGSCDAKQEIMGRRDDIQGSQFWCEACGELNILPTQAKASDGLADAKPQLRLSSDRRRH